MQCRLGWGVRVCWWGWGGGGGGGEDTHSVLWRQHTEVSLSQQHWVMSCRWALLYTLPDAAKDDVRQDFLNTILAELYDFYK